VLYASGAWISPDTDENTHEPLPLALVVSFRYRHARPRETPLEAAWTGRHFRPLLVFQARQSKALENTPKTSSKGNAMSDTYELKAEARERVGKGSSRELRRNGFIFAMEDAQAPSGSPLRRRNRWGKRRIVMKARMFVFTLATALIGLLAFSSGALAAKPLDTGNGDGSGNEPPDYGDLVILYRDQDGIPYLTPEGCQQPIAFVSDTCPMECVVGGPGLVAVDPDTCAVTLGCETCTQEVDFEGLDDVAFFPRD